MTVMTSIRLQQRFLHCNFHLRPMNATSIRYFLVFLLLAAIPAILQILLELSSYTQGFALNAFLVLCVALVAKRFSRYLSVTLKKIRSNTYLFLGTLALLHLVIIIIRWYIGLPVDFFKFVVGLTMGAGLLLQAIFISYIVIRMVDKNEIVAVNMFVGTYLLFGVIGIFGYTIFGSYNARKPVFFDSEISHYALGLIPLYCAWGIVTKNLYDRWFGHLIICTIGYLYQSTTIFIVVLSVILITSKVKFSFVILLIIIALLVTGGETSVYYTNRLSLNYSEDVIENMAYLQGWQEAFYHFYDSYGFGVGLQQFGIMDPRGDIALAGAARADGIFINRFDGSFGAAKIIGEFGIIGVILIIFLTIQIVNAGRKLRKLGFKSHHDNSQLIDVFAYSFVYAFFIYLFIRGGGYFGLNYVYLVAGLILIHLPHRIFKK